MAPEPLAVAVFARAPVPGQAKTRLIPVLGPEGAARLHARLVEHALAAACAAGVGSVSLWCDGIGHPFFRACAARFPVTLVPQPPGDLGARMAAALAPGPALLLGCDCPGLGAAQLQAAAAALARGLDAVFQPVEDGGYALVGTVRFDGRLFQDIAWGSAQVMAQTRARLTELGWRWEELPPRWDVDRPEDLPRLAREWPALAPPR